MGRKLNKEQLILMRELLESGMAGSQVAIQIGCSDRAVYERRQRWNMRLESTRPKLKAHTKISEPKPKTATATKYWHGHHFGPLLKCGHCGIKHPGSTKKWNHTNWTQCESAPAPENIEPAANFTFAQGREEMAERTHCAKRNHEMTFENTYVTPQGRRECRACRGINNERRKQAAMEGK